MKRLIIGAVALTSAGCFWKREPALPAPIPAIEGERRSIPVALEYIDFVKGTGAMVAPRQCIYTHYTGWLTNGTKFDSSRDTMPNGRPRDVFSFNQGLRRLIIPPTLAYGDFRNASIPPNATLVFDVELLAVNGSS